MIINETSFLVRTLFFVVFGMTLPLATLLNGYVWLISAIMAFSLIATRKVREVKPKFNGLRQ